MNAQIRKDIEKALDEVTFDSVMTVLDDLETEIIDHADRMDELTYSFVMDLLRRTRVEYQEGFSRDKNN